jgi:hypothetical protein
VEVANDDVHLAFAKVINWLPVRIPGVCYREGLDSFNSERSQEKRVSSFEISYPTHTFTFKMRPTLKLGMLRLMNMTSDRGTVHRCRIKTRISPIRKLLWHHQKPICQVFQAVSMSTAEDFRRIFTYNEKVLRSFFDTPNRLPWEKCLRTWKLLINR